MGHRSRRDAASEGAAQPLGRSPSRRHGAGPSCSERLPFHETRSCGHLWVRLRRLAPRRHLRSEEHTSELQSRQYLVCRLLLEKKQELLSCTRLNATKLYHSH